MNCPNCGRPLAEGEVCNCANEAPVNPTPAEAPQPEAAPQPEPAPQYTAQQQYYAPDPSQGNPYAQPYYQPQGVPGMPMPVVNTPPRRDYPEGYKPKRKYVAVILAATLGPLGIHNFYLGNKNKALAQLLICVIGSLLVGLGFIAAWVWAIVDAVELFTEKQDRDADGFKIQTFEEALVAERMRAEKEAAEK